MPAPGVWAALGRARLDVVWVEGDVGHEAVVRGGGARRQLVARVARQPRVPQHVGRAQPLAGLAPQQRPDQALAPRRQTLRHHEVPAGYLREQRRVLRIVERIPEKDNYVRLLIEGTRKRLNRAQCRIRSIRG